MENDVFSCEKKKKGKNNQRGHHTAIALLRTIAKPPSQLRIAVLTTIINIRASAKLTATKQLLRSQRSNIATCRDNDHLYVSGCRYFQLKRQ